MVVPEGSAFPVLDTDQHHSVWTEGLSMAAKQPPWVSNLLKYPVVNNAVDSAWDVKRQPVGFHAGRRASRLSVPTSGVRLIPAVWLTGSSAIRCRQGLGAAADSKDGPSG